MRSLLVIVCLALVLAELCHGKKAADSCMKRWMTRAGIKSGTDKHESVFKSLRYGENDIVETDTKLLGVVMGQSYSSARSLQLCISGKKRECKAYDPCSTNGVCRLNKDGGKYECKCIPGRDGAYCQKGIDECASNPCQHGGFCKDGVNKFTCTCAAGFEGLTCEKGIDECASNPCQHGGFCKDGVNKFTCTCAAGFEGVTCEKRWLKASEHRHLPTKVKGAEGGITKLSASFQALQKKMLASENSLKKEVSARKKEVSALKKEVQKMKMEKTVIGYKYGAWRHYTARKSGEIRSLRFTKKQGSSLLRLSFSANLNTNRSPGKYAKWYFLIDGRKCTNPTNIDVAVLQTIRHNPHFPGYLTGICKATSAGTIGRGTHTIAVNIETNGRAQTGWNSMSFMEVQEIRPPL